MKRQLILLILIFLFGNTFSQNKTIDSLINILKSVKQDTIKVNALLAIANEYYLSEPRVAIQYCEQAKNISLRIGFKKGLGDALAWLAYLYDNQGDTPKALEYYQKSLKISKETGDKNGLAHSLGEIGAIYKNQGDIPKALEYLHQSLKIKEEIGDKRGISYSLNNFGFIYQNQGDIPKALEYYNKSLKIMKEIGDKNGIAHSLNNIGAIYKFKGDNTKALEYFHESLKIREEIGDKNEIAHSLNNIGYIYQNQGDLDKALEYFRKCLKIMEEIKNKKGQAFSLNNIANLMVMKGQLSEALSYSKKSMGLASEIGYPENIKLSANSLKKIFQKQNKYKEAFEMYELEIKMRDSINNQETQKASVKKQLQYTFEKQAAKDSIAHTKETEIKNIEIARQTAEISAKKNQQYALYGGLALVMVFAGVMFNRFKVTQKQKQIIEIKEKETQQQKHIIEEKHKEITDSINYAERIQRSFIATKEILDANLKDYFVFFLPKDIVSGDFYWASKLNNGNFALATADSTGHGVPGAIMSLLNITSLEKAIETYTEPSDILNTTRKTIIERLKNDGSEFGGKDGMDASLTVYDFKNKKLIIAAANNPVWIVRGSETIEIKPDKMPVGKHDKDSVSFTQQEIDLLTGDVVFTLTDGFPDQFGGEKGKKFMSKNLRELLSDSAHLPMQEQKQLLEQTFKNWVGNLEQVDDVTLIGVRI